MAMIMRFKMIIATILIVLCLILIPSVIDVTSAHEDNLYQVTEKRIIEAATLCIKEENCTSNTVYLYELYDYGYLEKEYDPVTKEYYSETSYVLFSEEKIEFIKV